MIKTNVSEHHQALYANNSRLNSLKSENQPEALQKVAQEFEAFFLQMVLKSMRDANKSFESGLIDSNAKDTYQEMHDKQLSMHLAHQGGTGLANLIVRQMSKSDMPKADASLINKPLLRQKVPVKSIEMQFSAHPAPIQQTESAPSQAVPPQSPLISSPETFVAELMPYAKKAGQALGVDPKVILAQAALETGWGKKLAAQKDQSSFNLFGIKADKHWEGGRTLAATTEFQDGVLKHERAAFRAYDSYETSFDDYTRFLKDNPRYQHAIDQAHDPKQFVKHLSDAGYATDPNYAEKLLSVFHSPTLNAAIKLLG